MRPISSCAASSASRAPKRSRRNCSIRRCSGSTSRRSPTAASRRRCRCRSRRAGSFDLVEFPWRAARPAISARKRTKQPRQRGRCSSHLSAVIDALATPIAIFNARRELVQSNRAYAALWKLDPDWLKPGLDERAILDKLRTDGTLPNEPDYQAWRAKHLTVVSAHRAARERALAPAGRPHHPGDRRAGRAAGRRDLRVRGHHRRSSTSRATTRRCSTCSARPSTR